MHLLWFKNASEERIGYWAASGQRFLVSQTYHNGYHFYPKHQKIILLSAYSSMMHADEHWRKVQHDRYAAVINLNHAQAPAGIIKTVTS